MCNLYLRIFCQKDFHADNMAHMGWMPLSFYPHMLFTITYRILDCFINIKWKKYILFSSKYWIQDFYCQVVLFPSWFLIHIKKIAIILHIVLYINDKKCYTNKYLTWIYLIIHGFKRKTFYPLWSWNRNIWFS